MELLDEIVLLLHLIGFAALFGGILVQIRVREPEINAAMLHGSYTMLVTGLALAVFLKAGLVIGDINLPQLVIKLVISAIITFLVIINRRFTSIPRGLWTLLGVLTLGNAAVAVLWQ
ncbi:hypothetical protein GCM10011575_40320 [Microlunatus endophyticus]|uniref:Uncharacterized protein n=1 Tax=Microlunatus endophyticus TaxID=1716077 RepID=A0A917SGP4_9ACTN|nr:hypothetical protein [Microlunatus endophyticus]GGL77967.1 hypothetical protein GCM10011575_40320 [Microlunatus endophyticus]